MCLGETRIPRCASLHTLELIALGLSAWGVMRSDSFEAAHNLPAEAYNLRVKVYAYPDGTADGTAMLVPPGWAPPGADGDADAPERPPGRSAGARPERPEASREVLDEQNRRRSARRSRQLVVRHVRAQGFDCLGTLTIGGERLPDAYSALSLASRWYLQEGRRLVGERCILVPEHGERHARIHIHMGLRRRGRFIDYAAVYRSWSDFLTREGYVSPTSGHRVHFTRSMTSRRLSRYLAKYLGKAMDEVEVPKGAHRYRNMGCERVLPAWETVIDSVRGLCGSLGLRPSALYPFRVAYSGLEEPRLVGFGFDTAPPGG